MHERYIPFPITGDVYGIDERVEHLDLIGLFGLVATFYRQGADLFLGVAGVALTADDTHDRQV